jgi:hypothetical protein
MIYSLSFVCIAQVNSASLYSTLFRNRGLATSLPDMKMPTKTWGTALPLETLFQVYPLRESWSRPISIKDSFALLDLTPFGFAELFQAQWIFRQAPTVFSRQEPPDLQWKHITSEGELVRWEEAWSQPALPRNRLFLPALLHDADICVIAAYKEDQIVAGAIANRTTEVVGLSNVFAPKQEAERCWEGLLSQIATRYPSLPVVGYEHDESLTIASHVGFTTLGSLRVWIKEG